MPISATGNDRDRSATGGFTLIELLVVLAVMGMLSGVVVVTWPPGDPPALADARRFASAVREVRETGIVTGRTVGLAVDDRGWTALQADRAGWHPVQVSSTGSWTDRVRAVTSQVPAGRSQAPGPLIPALRFDPVGLATPFTLRLEGDGEVLLVAVDAAGKVDIRPAEGN